jgi:uncharacterized membrane protein YfcA
VVAWPQALAVGAGAMAGGWAGARLLGVVPDRVLKVAIVVIGLGLTAGLFWRAA